MINALKSLFSAPPAESPEALEHRLRLATAALLIETARADFYQDAEEEAALETLLCDSLALSRTEIQELVQQASKRVDHATSLYEFTRLINDHYSPAQKLQLIDAMWRVAYADGRLDKYEEHLIRQVAELTYVPHPDYIRSKLGAKPD
ncbi:tellurite resistance TerB family protein [Kineobactrum salinum]|uniref:TerB family tellurite resistance protein n=1 Tax=Kineobactrum salinum TaxID=2708301 RepID=A0A6C0TWG6_9GAMM|nr:TerB family tellurite resistance protein [Kineobactrum salinum]QIB64162.1 TerB family tellurite resistance protein [Kineobactrum salinum]